MSTVDTTSLNNVLEDVNLQKITQIMFTSRKEMNLPNTTLYDTYNKRPDVMADEVLFSLEIGGPESITPHTEGGTVEKEGEMSYEEATVSTKEFSGGFEITVETIKKANARGIGEAKRIVARIMSRIVHGIDQTYDYNFASEYSDGSGKMAQVNGAVVASATVIVDKPGIKGQFRKGQRLDIYVGATKQVDGIAIKDVDPKNNTLTLQSAVSCDDDAWVYRKRTKDSMFTGLIGMIGTTTFQNINPASGNSFWKSWVETGSGAFTFAMVDALFDNINIQGDGRLPDKLIIDLKTKNKANALNYANRTLQNVTEYKGGFTLGKTFVLNHADVPYHLNKYWDTAMIYATTSSDIERYEFVPLEWWKGDNDKILIGMTGKLDYEAKFFTWFNYGLSNRMLHGKLSGYTT